MPSNSAILARMASRCGPILGRSQMIVMSTLVRRAAALADKLRGVQQKHGGIRAAPLRIGGREMVADVAGADRAEQRIRQRMQAGVGVGVAFELLVMRYVDAAQRDVIAILEGMHVEAGSGPHIGKAGGRVRRLRSNPPCANPRLW